MLLWITVFTMVHCSARADALRVAAFNIWELSADKIDKVDAAGRGTDRQLRGAAEIVQRVRPHILLINEIDYSSERNLAAAFRDRYLKVTQAGQQPIDYPHIFYAPVNTGVPTGKDLDNDGKSDGPADGFGFGRYPGQYGMALLSLYPVEAAAARTFQNLLWSAMPGNLLPDGSAGKPAWYDSTEAAMLRLSSKSHWDVPVRVAGQTLHILCAHPTPPVFDGDEDRNGRRNFDEIRLLADYISGAGRADYIVDDRGTRGPLAPDASFVILGDLNADPLRDEAPYGRTAMAQLLEHPRVVDPQPTSSGAQGQKKPGPPQFLERKTCGFGRIDYVLCSQGLKWTAAGVFWPSADDALYKLVEDRAASSDHRLVWVDLDLGTKPIP